jgi:hypothetical protein
LLASSQSFIWTKKIASPWQLEFRYWLQSRGFNKVPEDACSEYSVVIFYVNDIVTFKLPANWRWIDEFEKALTEKYSII